MTTIRSALPTDQAAVSAICWATVEAGQAPSDTRLNPALPGLLYADPYFHGPSCRAVVAQDAQGLLGYAVGTADSEAFYRWLNQQWLPAQHANYPRPAEAVSLEQKLAARLYTPWQAPELAATYPAHLHINLLPRAQGQGLGKRLLLALLAQLHTAGAPGVHWGVDPSNSSALGFYRKLGFSVQASEPGCEWFGATLP